MNHGFVGKTAKRDVGLVSPSRRKFFRHSAALATGCAAIVAGLHGSRLEEPPAYQAWKQAEKGGLTDFEYIVQCGTLAANAHNTQSWSFSIQGQNILLYADLERNLGRADPQRRLMLMSLGCAVENMVVTADHLGYTVRIDDADAATFLTGGGLCAVLKMSRRKDSGSHPWFQAQFLRRTTRKPYGSMPMSYRDFGARLGNPSDLPGIQLGWHETPGERAAIVEAANLAVRRFVADDGAYRDSMAWFHRSRVEWEQQRDGISIFGSDAPLWVKEWVDLFASDGDLVSPAFRQGEVDVVQRLADSTPLWAMVRADENVPSAWFRAGRLIERIYLVAAAEGCAIQPISYPTESPDGLAELSNALSLGPRTVPLMLLRLGQSTTPSPSPRRDLSMVLR